MYSLYAVDDDALILDEVMQGVAWLESGFEVVGGTTDPLKAVEDITRLAPDAVLCDMKMPGMDGLTVLEQVRAQGVESEFVMLSAFGTFEDSRSFFLRGGFDYILKPLDTQEVQIVFERLARKLAGSVPGDTEYEPTGVPGFDELVAFITRHYSDKFTLDRLGRQFHLNPNYICNLFAKHYNSTFTTFLTDIRMRRAGEAVAGTAVPLKEVAVNCGFGSYFYFCRQFKAYYGCSPSAWREQGQGEEESGA